MFTHVPVWFAAVCGREHGAGQRECEEVGQEGPGEGLDARAESTKVPDEDMEDLVEGPPSENETATSTKRSQSKPEHGRGPLREAKQAKKALIHTGIVAKEEAEGLSPLEVLDMVKKYTRSSRRSCCSSWRRTRRKTSSPSSSASARTPRT